MKTTLYAFNGVVKTFQTHLEIHADDEARLVSLGYLIPVTKRCSNALNVIEEFMERPRFSGKHLILGPRFDRKLKLSLGVLDDAKGLFILAIHSDQQ